MKFGIPSIPNPIKVISGGGTPHTLITGGEVLTNNEPNLISKPTSKFSISVPGLSDIQHKMSDILSKVGELPGMGREVRNIKNTVDEIPIIGRDVKDIKTTVAEVENIATDVNNINRKIINLDNVPKNLHELYQTVTKIEGGILKLATPIVKEVFTIGGVLLDDMRSKRYGGTNISIKPVNPVAVSDTSRIKIRAVKNNDRPQLLESIKTNNLTTKDTTGDIMEGLSYIPVLSWLVVPELLWAIVKSIKDIPRALENLTLLVPEVLKLTPSLIKLTEVLIASMPDLLRLLTQSFAQLVNNMPEIIDFAVVLSKFLIKLILILGKLLDVLIIALEKGLIDIIQYSIVLSPAIGSVYLASKLLNFSDELGFIVGENKDILKYAVIGGTAFIDYYMYFPLGLAEAFKV